MKNCYFLVKSFLLVFCFSILGMSCSNIRTGPPKVLVFSKTAGFYHTSIPAGINAIQKLGRENGFEVDTTTNSSVFTEEHLRQYSAVVFLNTTGDVLNHYQEADFERYIQAGGGFVGIHSASDTEHHWGWYGRLVGGHFLDHPGINDPHPNVQEGVLHIENQNHPTTAFLPEQWNRTDEWYSFKNFNEDVHVLMTIDEASYQGGADMGRHPMAWYHEYDGGRAFYTASGHTSESYSDELFLNHILAGIQYAIGENKIPDYSKATTERAPEANRFTKKVFSVGEFMEPTEMTILPNLDILIAQRRGEILLYKSSDSTLSRAGYLDVYWQTDVPNVNAEEGLMGIQADPDFEDNGHVFVFYSPADTSVNRLSRFTFEDDRLLPESEKIVLEFYSQRDICCHTGGSIAFDSEGLLYLSTGDNSTPFNQPNQPYVLNGYAPLDERTGLEQYDARRTSANANDLRGKILRIRVNEDGSYSIPEGNLYPQGKEGTRPEIYIQGNRNPYRISVDQKTGYLYWGEIGPDADQDSLSTKGPRGYDEINQAREAGFFGWPLFVGDNYPYRRYNYATGEPGKVFDPDHPINDSPHNTGIAELPPARPAFIWYPYGVSDEFPQMGSGGRNAMAGPVYYTDRYPEETRLPDYYDGKLFIYDWVRNWIKVVTMQPNGDFDKMEPFIEHIKLNALIDMEVGPDGRLYLLEYGNGWFSQNDDSGLYRIDFNPGNRPPIVNNVSANKTSGTLPLTVKVTADASDPEQDNLTYYWDMGDGQLRQTSEPHIEHTYEEIGEYSISVEVRDEAGHMVQSSPVSVYAGNAAPEVFIDIEGNSTFYFPDHPVSYSVRIEDEDHPEAAEDLSMLFVSADYIEGSDLAEASRGHQVMTEVMSGKSLIESLDCQACHQLNATSIGPSYTAIAGRYENASDVSSYLASKIIEGGSGAWGERAMPAHPELSKADARKIVSWISSLTGGGQTQASLPASGTVDPTLGKKPASNGVLILSASYTDPGGTNIKPLTGNANVYLKSPSVSLEEVRNLDGYTTMDYDGNRLLMVPTQTGYFSLNQIDLTGIRSVEITTVSFQSSDLGYRFELRLDEPAGQNIGEAVAKANGEPAEEGFISTSLAIPMDAVTDGEWHDLYIVSQPVDEAPPGQLILSAIKFNNR